MLLLWSFSGEEEQENAGRPRRRFVARGRRDRRRGRAGPTPASQCGNQRQCGQFALKKKHNPLTVENRTVKNGHQ